MKNFYFISLIIILLLTNCGGSNKPSAGQESTEQTSVTDEPHAGEREGNLQATNVVVLCDISPSVTLLGKPDTNGIASRAKIMLKGCRELIRHYPPGSEIRFFLISSNALQQSFLTLRQPEVLQINQNKVLRNFKTADDSIAAVIDSSMQVSEKRTCILTSLEGALRELRLMERDNKHTQNELVIFSDMLEQCDDSPIGRIMMDQRKGHPLLAVADSARLASYQNKDVRKLNLSLRICMTTPYMPVSLAKKIQDTWTGIFSRIGIEQAVSGNLIFEPMASFKPYRDYQKGMN